MHSALFLDEILLLILGHCYPQPFRPSGSLTDLVALAATCQAFKEPALDVLWAELKNPTALVRCLPQVCCSKDSNSGGPTYMFKRQLYESERDAVKRYTRRIRSLSIGASLCLDPHSLVDLLLSSPTDFFFPNIRLLDFFITDQTYPLIHHMASPKLRWLRLVVNIVDSSTIGCFFYSLGSSCPNMESIEVICMSGRPSVESNHIMTQQIRCWNRLHTMDWSQVTLDIDTLYHLSQMPVLSKLSFTLSHASMEQIISPNHPLVFSTLKNLKVATKSITTMSRLLSLVLLPAMVHVSIYLETTPPRHSIKSFSTALARTRGSLNILCVMQISLFTFNSIEHVLTLDDIRPLMALSLTQICIDLDSVIDINDSSLVEFASSCQRLSSLTINRTFGWRTPGITPAGLAQILHDCRSLLYLSIALDTRDYFFSLQRRTSYVRSFLTMNVDVVDSVIEAKCIPALAAFFADQMLDRVNGISLGGWSSYIMCRRVPDADVYKERWKEVAKLAKQMVLEREPPVRSWFPDF